MGMRVVPLDTPELQALAAKLPRGRVFASGRAFVPFVRAGLYQSIAAAAGFFCPPRAQTGLYGLGRLA